MYLFLFIFVSESFLGASTGGGGGSAVVKTSAAEDVKYQGECCESGRRRRVLDAIYKDKVEE